MSKKSWKIVFASLFLAASFLLEIKQKAAFGWAFDFILVALLVLPLLLDLAGFFFFGALSFWLLKLIFPWNGTETILLISFPLLSFISQKVFPWQSWLEPFVIVLAGLWVFYGITNPANFFGDLKFLLLDTAFSMVFGWVLYYLMGIPEKHRT